eukprot:TRINITY_DN25246_c0_g1_i1.p1 TRINITY_DN25246_c0_g1~~TRINITY_DN25246_c0_g1_i1.p1  ORF type:complete len:392 (+),score=76.28 TRINITY_DN25246_c0_g1_i1:26-1177(+)
MVDIERSMKAGYGEVDAASDGSEVSDKIKWGYVLLCIILMNGTNLFMSEAMQGMENEYNNTMFLTGVVAMSYAYNIIIWLGWAFLRKKQWASCIVTQDAAEHRAEGAFDWWYLFKIGFPISIISKSCRDFWYYSLHQTNAAANNSIYQSSTAWVYVFSLLLLKEKFDLVKFSSLIVGVVGCVIVTLAESSSSESGVDQNFVGYLDLSASVLTYALFQVIVKKYVTHPQDPHPQMNSLRFCGVIGIWCFIWGPGCVAFLHVTGIRPFEWPSQKILLLVILNGVMDTIFTSSMLILVRLISPTFASMASILIVPLTIVADRIIHNYVAPPLAYVGMSTVILGCVIFNTRVYLLNRDREKGGDALDESTSLTASTYNREHINADRA